MTRGSTLTLTAGLAIMVGSEAATLAHVEPFWSWNTPICWTGFILFADAVVWRARGDSWLHSAAREFVAVALLSIPLWLVFEFYNRFIRNWYYTGLPENPALRYFGYAWAFGTIWPAMFEAAELVAVVRRADAKAGLKATARLKARTAPESATPPVPTALLLPALGLAMLIWPLVWPSQYLAAPVWLGFILLLDPINARLGAESLTGDFRAGRYDRAVNLAWAGGLCGILWEFWNYWSRAKWHYTVPILENVKIFEMPVLGYFGFPAFAVECFTMYVFVRAVARRAARLSSRRELGRRIAL